MNSVRSAVVVAALLLAGAARASSPNPGFANQEEQRATAALVRSSPFYTDLTSKDATPPSGFANQEEQRAAAALVLTTRPYADFTACPSAHEAAHEQIAQRALQVPDRDRGKLILSANCCTLANRMALAQVSMGGQR